MKKIVISINFILALIIAPVMLAADNEGFVVIVNIDNSINFLTKKQISKYFLKKSTKWSDGSQVFPVDLRKNSNIREDFTESVHEKSVSAINSYWQRLIYSGASSPPPVKKTEADIIKYVKSKPGAIGYISAEAPVDGVKVLSIQ